MFRFSSRIAPLLVAVLLVSPRPALAGPPLLCHPFEIGNAASLPWDGTDAWWQGRADYALPRLVADTEALLTPSTPVIVRMETLRRAALYASSDKQIATQLLAALTRRAKDAERPGASTVAGSMALFDAGYLAETLRQIGHLGEMAQFRTRAQAMAAVAAGAEGHALVVRSIALRPDDAGLQFAAALVTADRDRTAYQQHAAKARKGAAQDALLARNLKQIS